MTMQENVAPLLEMRGITKYFGDFCANDHIDLAAYPGTVHALVGENGAGKTTLMSVLFGIHQPTSGEILIKGNPIHLSSPVDARRYKIGMVHQHFKLVPSLTVTENIFLGQEPTNGPFVDLKKANAEVERLSKTYGLEVDPTAQVARLSVGLRQRVEILKALSYDAEVLILDEPTAVLTPQETQELFRIVRGFTAMGKAVIFITHKLKEVKEIADVFTVIRAGKKIATVRTEEASEADIARLMVGREVMFQVDKTPAKPGEVVLEVENLSGLSDRQTKAVDGVSFNVRRGEIVGIAGVEGNGQSELIDILTGLRPATGGEVKLNKKAITRASAQARRKSGMSHVPEDRLERGVSLKATIQTNLAAGHYEPSKLATRGWLHLGKIRNWAADMLKKYDVRGAVLTQPISSLSGGNMQKVVLAREIGLQPDLLIAAQPTRGVDVGATEFVYRTLVNARDEGRGILLISADLAEVLKLSDRILVMYRGRVTGEFEAAKTDENELGLYMMGVKEQERGETHA